MTWLAFVPTALIAAAVVIIPGGALAWSLRLRGFALIGTAAPLSISLIAVSATGAGAVGIPWSILPVLLLTGVAMAAAWAWTRWVGPTAVPPRRARRDGLVLTATSIVPMVVITATLVAAFNDPEYFSQRYDNFFHLNAVRYVLDTGNSSPLWVGTMTSPDGGLPFYPSGWHAVVSLVMQLSGAGVVAATNATIIVVAAVVWPLAAVLLVRTVLGRGIVTTAAAAAISAAFPAFPFLPLHYGVLYPLFLGLACAPAALAAAWRLLRPGRDPRRHDRVLILLLLIPGVAIAHPGALLAVLALAVPMVLAAFAYKIRRSSGGRRLVWAAGVLAYAVVGAVVLVLVRPPADQIYWPAIESLPHAIGSVVSAAVFGYPVSAVVALLVIAGAYSVVRRPTYPRIVLLGSAVVGAVLYVIVAGATSETLRTWLTGPWYNNAPRLASIWVLGAIPVAAIGAVHIARRLSRMRVMQRWYRAPWRRPHAAALMMAVVLTALTQGSAMGQARADIEYTYLLRPDAPIVTPDEFELMEELSDLVPADAVIAGDPYTGASFAYALSGRKVLLPHLLMDVSGDAELINRDFARHGDDPAMCAALAHTGVSFILDFSEGGDFMDNDADFAGLVGLADSPYAELVAEEGGARLYRVTSCGVAS
jgi:hypothetical protein